MGAGEGAWCGGVAALGPSNELLLLLLLQHCPNPRKLLALPSSGAHTHRRFCLSLCTSLLCRSLPLSCTRTCTKNSLASATSVTVTCRSGWVGGGMGRRRR